MSLTLSPFRHLTLTTATTLGLGACLAALAADPKPGPKPSGPQVDGAFHKVILDTDRDQDGDGQVEDTVVNPMEIAVAPDGRVFFIERSGLLKVWSPTTQASTIAGTLKVFTELEDGLLGIALDPKFAKNSWIYLFYSDPQTHTNDTNHKIGENRVSASPSATLRWTWRAKNSPPHPDSARPMLPFGWISRL